MARFLVQLGELVVDWSTTWDAPVTPGMTREELTEYIGVEYGRSGMRDLPTRLARLDSKGTSAHDAESAQAAVMGNRAGPDETTLRFGELVELVKRSRAEWKRTRTAVAL